LKGHGHAKSKKRDDQEEHSAEKAEVGAQETCKEEDKGHRQRCGCQEVALARWVK
jgi:hypothetical protein